MPYNPDEITAVVLRYEEPNWTDATLQSLFHSGIKNIRFANRDGVGNMSRAFNEAIFDSFGDIKIKTKYVWWLTNVTFTPDVPERLTACFEGNVAAVHPAHKSDHSHLVHAQAGENIPFIELTAPMFESKALDRVGRMDEQMPYWGMDLDWSHRAANMGYKLRASSAGVDHEYLRLRKKEYPITRIREELRKLYDGSTTARLSEKYGPEWRKIVWP